VPPAPEQPGYGAPAYETPGDAAPGYGAPGYAAPPGYGTPPGYPAPQGYGTPPGYAPPQGYGAPQGYWQGYPTQPAAPTNASTVVLTVISALFTVSCYGTLIGIAPLILAIIALTRNSNDPQGARSLTKIGWIVFGSLLAIAVVLVIVAIAVAANSASRSTYN
jgi:hypothetical protein